MGLNQLISVSAVLAAAGCLLSGQDWTTNGGDPGGSRYSRIRQITRENVAKLKVAWTYHTGDMSDGTTYAARSSFEATPLVVGNVMYLTTPFSRLIALDAETGKELWKFDPKIDMERTYPLFVSRGAVWWTDGTRQRVFLGTLDGRLFSIDARTGKQDDSFGMAGWIDLRKDVADQYSDKGYGMTSPPAVYKNVVICGSITADAEPQGPKGDIRGFDARTGKQLWVFHTVPRKGEFGNDTWEGESWKDRSAVNAWSNLSVDTERGIVFLPLTSPGTDLYGGDRKGAGLFGDALVALDAATGKRLWHYQTVHHDLWDYDLPAQPNLVEVKRGGRLIPAVAQVTKTGFAFVFDRVTGKPLFDIEEVPVPKSDVEGEESSPMQPRPVKPAPFARVSFQADELANLTPESAAFCAKLLEGGTVLGGVFTPVGLRPTVFFPGSLGGANWGGASYDPETRTLFVNSMDFGNFVKMVKRPEGQGVPYRSQPAGARGNKFVDQDGNPCQRPPWGSLTAINLDTGDFRWKSVLGVVDSLVAKGIPPTGIQNLGGSLVTAGGLVFIGATNDKRFRAFDKDNGKELWTVMLPASAHASPMTFVGEKTKKQFVVIAAGGGNRSNNDLSDAVVAYTLP